MTITEDTRDAADEYGRGMNIARMFLECGGDIENPAFVELCTLAKISPRVAAEVLADLNQNH